MADKQVPNDAFRDRVAAGDVAALAMPFDLYRHRLPTMVKLRLDRRLQDRVELSADAIDSTLVSVATFALSMDQTSLNAPVSTRELTSLHEPDRSSEAGITSMSLPMLESDSNHVDELVLNEEEYDPDALLAELDDNLLSDWSLDRRE